MSSSNADISAIGKIALEHLSLAKAEILIRIRVRDTLLATYAAAAFTAMAAILGTTQLGQHFLYGLPYLCFAFSILISYHHAGIGALGTHCALDLLPIIEREGNVLGYEHSKVFKSHHSKHNSRRVIAHVMILLLPAAIAMTVNFSDLADALNKKSLDYFSAAWIGSLGLMLLSLWLIIRSNRAHYKGLEFHDRFPSTTVLDQLAPSSNAPDA